MRQVIGASGAGGFIAGHLVARLSEMYPEAWIKAVDVKPLDRWYQRHPGVENRVADLSKPDECWEALGGCTEIYGLAADMGGVGYILANQAECLLNARITMNTVEVALRAGVDRLFWASSACAYSRATQGVEDVEGLREEDAWPADPEPGYGLEKLYGEEVCRAFHEQYGLQTRVARFHNVFGTHGAINDGREKAPAALCRKVAVAALTGNPEVEVWGDGRQTRSFLYVDECVDGILRIMQSDVTQPLNLGSSELISINSLALLIADIAGVRITLKHDLTAPVGVRGRSSNNDRIEQLLGWKPSAALRDGLETTYAWIYDQVKASL